MKNKFIIILTLFIVSLFIPSAMAQDETFFGIGAELFQDPFNKKIIITKIIPNSPAERTGLTAGSEIVSVDGVKVRKMSCICEVTDRIRGQKDTGVTLVIRNGWRWKKVEIIRDTISIPIPEENKELEAYWRQVAPECFSCSRFIPKEITDKFSRKYRKTILPVVNYWISRKAKFEAGYNTCASYSKNNKELCLINLLNRENETTNTDKALYKILRGELK